MIVGIASCYVVRSGRVYGHSVFVLCGPPARHPHNNAVTWEARSAAARSAAYRLDQDVADKFFGRLPLVGALRDVGGQGVDLSW